MITDEPLTATAPMPLMRLGTLRGLCLAILSLGVLGGWASPPAYAGGGPENVVVVVNTQSAGSKQVANHYVHLRNIPAANVVALDYSGSKEAVPGSVFRDLILTPVINAINQRGLALQIDTITYSTDFPWRISLKSDYPEEVKLGPQFNPVTSITGATYLYRSVLAKSPVTVTLDSNWYYASAPGQGRQTNAAQCRQLGAVPSRAFRGRYGWKQDGIRTVKARQGRRYLLSTMLGVTTGRGNTLEEVIASLNRAVEAEASPPDGTFYYLRNKGVRSQARHSCFNSATTQLRGLGAKAKVRQGTLPTGAQDVAGLMTGSANLSLDTARMKILPGAICEHLTSTGGVLFEKGYQTPISKLIRAGATGSSGTIIEPYAIQAKFPTPALHLHYRRGCSLAEAFYQSVASPYQLLILGDPLCQPWAERPTLTVEGWPANDQAPTPGLVSTFGFAELGINTTPQDADENVPAPAAGDADGPAPLLKIRPTVLPAGNASGTAYWELFVDGRLKMRLPSGKEVGLTAEQIGPGWHELRCVGFNPDAIEGQRRQDGQLEIGRDGTPTDDAFVTLTCAKPSASLDSTIVVEASSDDAERIAIWHNSRGVGLIDGDAGKVRIQASDLGRGPVRLQAIAQPSGAASPPLWVQVD